MLIFVLTITVLQLAMLGFTLVALYTGYRPGKAEVCDMGLRIALAVWGLILLVK